MLDALLTFIAVLGVSLLLMLALFLCGFLGWVIHINLPKRRK